MNENLKSWVEALRSGEYTQGAPGALCDEEGGFCCLGVACELAVQAGVATRVGTRGYAMDGRSSFHMLPTAIREWLGLPESFSLTGERNGRKRSLAGLNDGRYDDMGNPGRRTSFKRIADIVEREFGDA